MLSGRAEESGINHMDTDLCSCDEISMLLYTISEGLSLLDCADDVTWLTGYNTEFTWQEIE